MGLLGCLALVEVSWSVVLGFVSSFWGMPGVLRQQEYMNPI